MASAEEIIAGAILNGLANKKEEEQKRAEALQAMINNVKEEKEERREAFINFITGKDGTTVEFDEGQAPTTSTSGIIGTDGKPITGNTAATTPTTPSTAVESNSSYPDLMSDILKDGNRIGYGSITFSDLIERFDISRFPDFENAAEPYLAYVIMSRPDLNLSNPANRQVLANNVMTSGFFNDRYGQELMFSLSNTAYGTTTEEAVSSSTGNSSLSVYGQTNQNRFLPIVTSRAMSYSTVDVALKTVTKATTFYGHTIKYGKHSEDHKLGGTFSMEFRNDRFLSIIKMIYLWMCYIWLVSKTGDIEPAMEYQQNAVLDYAASVYYLVVRRDNRELVFWEKLTGVFPLTNQFSMFSYNDNMILQDRINVDFDFGMRSDPNDPEVLIDLNVLSGFSYTDMMNMSRFDMTNLSTSYGNATVSQDPFFQGIGGIQNVAFANSLEMPFALGNCFATCPFAHTVRMRDGSLRYYLDWVKAAV